MQIIFFTILLFVLMMKEKFNSKHLRFRPEGVKRTLSSLLEIPKMPAEREEK